MEFINIFSQLIETGSVILASSKVKEFNKIATKHDMPYQIGPHVAGKSVLITI